MNILKEIPNKNTLFETILVTCNDEFVKKFLKNEINYNDIYLLTNKFIKKNDLRKYKKISPKNISEVINLSKYVRNKINTIYN